jgi:hypothetical protein
MRNVMKQVFLVSAFTFVFSVSPVRAQTTASPGVGFAMVGIASGQTARLNALNLAAADPANPTSCGVTLQFLDTQANILKQVTVNLLPGNATSLDLNQTELQTTVTRSEIRAVVLFGYVGGANPPGPVVQKTACGFIVPSLEIFDSSTGITNVILVAHKQLPSPTAPAQ